ncbi:MAG TPA: RagB/SusD family nutrient uptake outer membrane protein [Chitinophagaceae bacterium]|nr:RagB/SusD family nutrient uptake outer membrane protein [Chitinophagaceae bacterium]
MKHIINILLLAGLFIISSCGKSFIERPPVSAATVDVLYKTDKDFQDAVMGGYQALRNQYTNFWQFGDLRGDDAFIQVSNQPTSTNIDVFSLNSSDALLNNTWANYYIVINLANNIITKIANADAAVVKNKDRYIGEAKFLRAIAYFDLVRIFGDVQMITNIPTADEVAKIPRTPAATIYAEIIIKDLLDAGAKLPQSYTGTEVGRATKGAAKAILGKVYMTVKDFPKAEAVLQELTTAPYTYALLPNYNDLFDYSKNEHHSEYIFDIEYEEGLGGLGSNWTNGFMPNVTALLNYYKINGGFGESLCPTMLFINLWQANDKRKDISVQCCGQWKNPTTGAVTIFSSQTSQSYTMKYITAVATQNDSKANWKVIRYADVLLMYAEALNENGKTPLALTPLNQIRTRAGLPVFSTLTQTEARDSIAQERRFELCFEGHRWFDLVRTGKALTACAPVGMKDYMTVFPVPLTQVRVMNNPTIFPQNNGYN